MVRGFKYGFLAAIVLVAAVALVPALAAPAGPVLSSGSALGAPSAAQPATMTDVAVRPFAERSCGLTSTLDWSRVVASDHDPVGSPSVDLAGTAGPKRGPGEWVLKNESLGSGASYQAANVPGRAGQTYRVPFKKLNPRGRPYVDFDDFERELNALIEYKTSIRTTKKGLDQALRQVAAAQEHGAQVIWRVPTHAQRL